MDLVGMKNISSECERIYGYFKESPSVMSGCFGESPTSLRPECNSRRMWLNKNIGVIFYKCLTLIPSEVFE